MNKFILSLFSSPVLISSFLTMGVMLKQAQAIEPTPSTTSQKTAQNRDNLSCIRNKHKVGLVCARASVLAQIPAYQAQAEDFDTPDDIKMLEFNVEESNMAVDLFGCDCPACINSLRAMRGVTPLVY
ncbi:hypothetical protein [Sphaerospermopsis torques-reginae]|uniref:Uncharacterized protein n=1 Tax=Sphaerospermopsis torques-reginae ITEP-024 TaxID=984208 RepID=A0ABX8X6J5_9CYAN|nr:hypothetical protein [Sphaerospermopsis torques-reginae]QYX34337.1 hypothetical protein K2F26_22425 [Sphaerospermopsis torques-reginae ITEP-024]